MKYLLLLTTLLALLGPSGSAQAAIYKWIDANGTVTFRDTPPPAGVEATVVTTAPLNVVDTAANPAPSQATQLQETPLQASHPRADVELYTTSWCGYCRKARAYLEAHGISYRDYDVEKDPDAAQRMLQLSGGYSGIPFAVINGRKIYGFDQAGYAQALGIR